MQAAAAHVQIQQIQSQQQTSQLHHQQQQTQHQIQNQNVLSTSQTTQSQSSSKSDKNKGETSNNPVQSHIQQPQNLQQNLIHQQQIIIGNSSTVEPVNAARIEKNEKKEDRLNITQ